MRVLVSSIIHLLYKKCPLRVQKKLTTTPPSKNAPHPLKMHPGQHRMHPALNPGVHLVSKLALYPKSKGDPAGASLAFGMGDRVRIMSAHAGGMCMRQCAHCRIPYCRGGACPLPAARSIAWKKRSANSQIVRIRRTLLVVKVCFRREGRSLSVYDLCAEGSEGKLRDLEELPAKGDANDGEAPEHADQQIPDGHPDPEKRQPDDVGQR